MVVHYSGISLLFNLLVLKRGLKNSVIKFYKAVLYLKHSNFEKHYVMLLKF